MCEYYCHAFDCNHLTYAFGRFCPSANLIQTPCATREVWQTISIDAFCDECRTWLCNSPDPAEMEHVEEKPVKTLDKSRRLPKRTHLRCHHSSRLRS